MGVGRNVEDRLGPIHGLAQDASHDFSAHNIGLRNGLLEQGNQDIPHVVSVLGQSTFCGSRHAVRAREKLAKGEGNTLYLLQS